MLYLTDTGSDRPSNDYYTIVIDMQKSQTIASVFLFAPGFISLPFISFSAGGGYGVTITGYITIGDSTEFSSNAKCADIAGIGYYTCASSLRGRYLTFISSEITNS